MTRHRPGLNLVRPPTRAARVGDRERGSAAVQLAVLMPALFTLMFLGMQAALMYHGRTVAIAAAQEGARAAAAQHATTGAGQAAATAFVASAGGDGVLRGVRVSSNRTTGPVVTGVAAGGVTGVVTVVVAGTTLSVVPGWTPQISQSASAPVEELTR
ncbi:TadE family protein [Lapillicoccus sp.]|uniref:TadE family protein n=1 Tax=Lapillicoccus sp. TaxID=1909287 RepID=UPI0025EA477B|nr:TadE family protein [Lapillicoccus sp.]